MQTDHVIHSISLISIIPDTGEKTPAPGRAWISGVNEGGDHGNSGALVVLSKRLKAISTVKT